MSPWDMPLSDLNVGAQSQVKRLLNDLLRSSDVFLVRCFTTPADDCCFCEPLLHLCVSERCWSLDDLQVDRSGREGAERRESWAGDQEGRDRWIGLRGRWQSGEHEQGRRRGYDDDDDDEEEEQEAGGGEGRRGAGR